MDLNNIWNNVKENISSTYDSMKDKVNQLNLNDLSTEDGFTTKNMTSWDNFKNAILGLGIEKVRNTEIGQELENKIVESTKKEVVYSSFNGIVEFLKGPYGILTLIVTVLIFVRGRL